MKMRAAQLLEPGNKVKVLAGHPWAGEVGELMAYETYGLGWQGWRVRLPHGHEFYANPSALRLVKEER